MYNTNSTSITLSSSETSFTIDFGRVKIGQAATISVSASGDTEYFTIPSSVSFGQYDEASSLTITYDPDELGFDNAQTFTLTISDSANTTEYGASEMTFTATIPSPWTSLGICSFYDDFWYGETLTCEIFQNDLDPTLFKLKSPFGMGDEPQLRILQVGEEYRGVTITKEDLVGFEDIDIVYYDSYGADVYALHPGRFTSMQSEDHYQYNKVLSYQANGLPAQIQLAPAYYMFGVGGWTSYTKTDGMFVLTFPGVVLSDYSIEVAYAGKFSDADEVPGIIANVTFGEDVASAKVAVVAGKGSSDDLAGIIDGTIESVEVTASGDVNVSYGAEMEDGFYTIYAVSYDAEGEAQEVASVTVKYQAGAAKEDWIAAGTGTYTYNGFFSGDDEGLEIFQSSVNSGKYKVEHWGNDVDFVFTITDPLTGAIAVEEQAIGYEYGSYGMVYVANNGKDCYYDAEARTFNFTLDYFVSAGYLVKGAAETFVLDAPEDEESKAEAVEMISEASITSAPMRIK